MNMTWKEFKKIVEDELQRQGLSEDVEIHYIDIHGGDTVDVELKEYGQARQVCIY